MQRQLIAGRQCSRRGGSLVDDTLLCDLSDVGTSTKWAHATGLPIQPQVRVRWNRTIVALHIAIAYDLPHCEKLTARKILISVFL